MKRIDNIQTKDYIADAIRNEILAGNIEAGEELTQEALAETLGVSRMPVREALQSLVQEGFIERKPNRHIHVVSLNKPQICESFKVFSSIESSFLHIINSNKKDVSELLSQIDKITSANDSETFAELELNFHYILLEHLDNKYLEQMFVKLLRGYIQYAINNLGDIKDKIKLFEEIKKSIKDFEIDKLEKAFTNYYLYYADKF